MRNPWFHVLPAAFAVAALNSQAQEQLQSFNLPAAPLAVTLNAIAGQSGAVLALEPALVQGKQAPAVMGRMTALQAMHSALV
ncbi:hypothetical protein, partial [Pseudomonas protegens]|uniref:hypothetical protein n=1 Tax=Pseudomonas protegens TaxID=380021 RepID=UPI00223ADDB0